MTNDRYSFSITLPLSLSEAESRVRQALEVEKFGIISEIDIQAKLKEKLGVDHHPHKILGACNPKLAYEALQDNADVALVIPCNVVLEGTEGETIVSAIFPSIALAPFKGENVRETASKAEEALARVFKALSTS
jgi:uncharacterized protein (DUF302 family)